MTGERTGGAGATIIDIDGRALETIVAEATVGPAGEPGRPVVAVGVFDGVHLGHRSLLQRARAEADRRQAPLWALTFWPHPETVVGRRDSDVGFLLSTLEEKAGLLRAAGADRVVALDFNATAAEVDAADFFSRCLVRGLQAGGIVVGFNFTFGRGGSGGPALLEALGRSQGIPVVVHPAVRLDGEVVSSSSIREALRAGDVERAGLGLGRPYSLAGPVEPGAARGRRLGFPTANVAFPAEKAAPASGVYVCAVSRGEGFAAGAALAQPAVANLGVSPTFAGAGAPNSPRLEAHVLDGQPPGYGEMVRVYFLKRLRAERRFDNSEELVAQIARDRVAALGYFGRRE